MREICTEIEIAGSPARVWEVLTRFDEYPQWNPFIPHVAGDLREGGRLEVSIRPPGQKPMTFRPVVVCVSPQRELRWLGRLWLPRVLDGEHAFLIEALGAERVRLVQRERFRGLLLPLLWRSLVGPARRGHEDMNAALKRWVEDGGQGHAAADAAEPVAPPDPAGR